MRPGRGLGSPEARDALHATLIAPAERHLDGEARVVICPDGVLYYVPWAALRDPTGRTVLDRAAVVLGHSLQTLQLLRDEAAAATGDPDYARSAAEMADFLVRIQTSSITHPELDGSWYRSFDFKKRGYWGPDGDAGGGVWTMESGWTHSWITATLALRQLGTSLWELTENSRIADVFGKVRPVMLPEDAL